MHRIIAKRKAPTANILVVRDIFTLYFYWRERSKTQYWSRAYPIAIGKIGDETPGGAYYVDAKSPKPTWYIPEHEDYPEEKWGTEVPFGDENNPFKSGFLSLSDREGVGIHDTTFDPRVGEKVSHGCIRMREEDFKFVYKRTPLGSPVTIA